MKTIEGEAIFQYETNKALPKKYQIEDNMYIDWFAKGVKFAQRWIPIEEELPPIDMPVIVKAQFVGRDIIDLVRRIKSKELHSGWQWSCIEIKTYSTIVVTHWRPIELK